MAVGYLVASNIKITMTHACKASDLMSVGEDNTTIISNNKVISVLPDEDHYSVKINKIPTWYDLVHPMTINDIHKELTVYVLEYDKMKKWRPPKWLGSNKLIQSKQFASIVIDLTSEKDKHTLLNLRTVKLFNFNCTVTPYENRIQVYQCNNCGMFSHTSNSCTTPWCRLCGSKDHSTDNHPTDAPLHCINCKGNHDSSHKECNTQRIRLGLKPIPHKNIDTNKKAQNNPDKNQPPRPNQRRKENEKGKERESLRERDPITKNIGLSNDDITALLANNPSQTKQHEHMAKLIHNQAKDKLTIKIPARGKPTNTPAPKPGSEMEVDEPTASHSQ